MHGKSKLIAVAVISLSPLMGCGSSDIVYDTLQTEFGLRSGIKDGDNPTFRSPKPKGIPDNELLKSAWVLCAGNQCPTEVGMLVAIGRDEYDSDYVSRCTAFMVSKNIAMTNAHCVPEDLRKRGASCNERMALVFPETGTKAAKTVECGKVLSYNGPSTKGGRPDRDFAFLKLKSEPRRGWFKVSQNGVRDQQPISIASVTPDHEDKAPGGYLAAQSCVVQTDTIVLPRFARENPKYPTYPLFTTKGCTVEHGNSGSPVLDLDTDRVVGLIQIKLDGVEYEKTVTDLGWEVALDLEPLGKGTNLSCVKFPTETGVKNRVNCSVPKLGMTEFDKEYKVLKKNISRDYNNELTQIESDGLAKAAGPNVFAWEAGIATLERESREFLTLQPKCVLREFDASAELRRLQNSREKRYQYQVPSNEMSVRVNSDWTYRGIFKGWTLPPLSGLNLDIVINLKSLSETRKSLILLDLSGRDFTSYKLDSTSSEIAVCE